jgi:capsular polysaccharide biosynthesis protein
LIAGIFLIAVLAAGAIGLLMPSIYRASCIIALGNFGDPVYTTEDTAKELLLSDEMLGGVIAQLKLDAPAKKLRAFKEGIEIKHIADNVLEISIETDDQENATKIAKTMVSNFVGQSEERYNKYRGHLSERLVVDQQTLAALDNEINLTRETQRELEKLPGVSQETLELRYSRTLEYLNSMESRRASLMNEYLSLKKELDFMENAKILAVSEEPTEPVKPRRLMIISVAGMLGLMVGIFAAFLKEGLERPAE